MEWAVWKPKVSRAKRNVFYQRRVTYLRSFISIIFMHGYNDYHHHCNNIINEESDVSSELLLLMLILMFFCTYLFPRSARYIFYERIHFGSRRQKLCDNAKTLHNGNSPSILYWLYSDEYRLYDYTETIAIQLRCSAVMTYK